MTRTVKLFDREGGALLATTSVDAAGKALDAVALADGATWAEIYDDGVLTVHGAVEVVDPAPAEFIAFCEGLVDSFEG